MGIRSGGEESALELVSVGYHVQADADVRAAVLDRTRHVTSVATGARACSADRGDVDSRPAESRSGVMVLGLVVLLIVSMVVGGAVLN